MCILIQTTVHFSFIIHNEQHLEQVNKTKKRGEMCPFSLFASLENTVLVKLCIKLKRKTNQFMYIKIF